MLLDAASRIRCIQKVAHFSFHTCFGGKAGEIRNTGSRQKIQTKRNKAKTVYRTEYTGKQFSFQKINCIATACPYQKLVLLSSPSCRPSLLLLLRRTHELLANSCLLSSCSSFFFVVVYPDVLLMKQRSLLLRACEVLIKKTIRTGFKREKFILHLRYNLRYLGS